MTRGLALLISAALMAGALPGGAAFAAEPRTTLSDIEDEVMCPVCGTPLALAENAPQANREREFIQHLIDQGRTKDQIKDALVAEFGEAVLATPGGDGFDLAAYIVPALAILLAGTGIALAVPRWRRARRAEGPGGKEPEAPADSARLDADMKRYDL